MRNSFSLGRVAGIEIGLNWSVLGLLALLMWTLATGIFPETNPGLGDDVHFAMAVVASLAFFTSILLHELGHALQARRDGMRIDGITLWLFGGVARFGGMFPSAGAEFRIAIAGPVVSAFLGAGFIGIALVPGIAGPVDGVASWLGFTNLALLLFNLIPALPLDGGRMLRAALWRRTGDLRRATVLASGAGRVLAMSLIGLGIAAAIFLDTVSGVWLAFIGWFVLQAADAEARYVMASDPGTMLVGDMMRAEVATTAPDRTLRDVAAAAGAAPGQAAYPVVEGGRVCGLLPLAALDGVPHEEWGSHRVGDLMLDRHRVPILSARDGLPAALAALGRAPVRSALVLDGEQLVGLLSDADIARALADRAPSS